MLCLWCWIPHRFSGYYNHCYIWCWNMCQRFLSLKLNDGWSTHGIFFLDFDPAIISRSSFVLHHSVAAGNFTTMDVLWMKFQYISVISGHLSMVPTLHIRFPAATPCETVISHLHYLLRTLTSIPILNFHHLVTGLFSWQQQQSTFRSSS